MNNVLTLLEGITILTVVKVLIVILLGVYSVFAALMMRQVIAMTKAVQMKDDVVIRILGFVHFVFAALVLLMAVFIL